MACKTGYRIPSSQEIESFLASHSSGLFLGNTSSLSSWSTRNVIKPLGFEISILGYQFVLETTLLFLDLHNLKY
jgi:hypothetical protein